MKDPRIIFGEGCLEQLPSLESVRGATRVALFAGGRALKGNPTVVRAEQLLAERTIVRLYGILPEPRPADLDAFEEAFLAASCEAIVAVGGGSVLDVAKGVASRVRRARDRRVALVAIPTTAGTGAEATPFATFWDRTEKRKLSLEGAELLPNEAIVDPTLTETMPRRLAMCTGIDALAHGCEAYWNVNCSAESDEHALLAISMIADALPRVDTERGARTRVMRASLEAGRAIASTRTTASHALSYAMTVRFGAAHGEAVAITLPEVVLLNADAATEKAPDATAARRKAARFCEALGVPRIADAGQRIRGILRECGLATRLAELSIPVEAIPAIAADAVRSPRMRNSPFAFTEAAAVDLLRRIA